MDSNEENDEYYLNKYLTLQAFASKSNIFNDSRSGTSVLLLNRMNLNIDKYI